jgi:acetoin utilization protein AcuB
MMTDVVTVGPDTAVDEALEVIRTHNIRHLPVLEGDRLVGVVTDRDLRLALDPGAGEPGTARVEDVMSRTLVVAHPHMPIEGAAALLAHHRIGCLPVVEEGVLVGILTESDLLRAFVELMAGRERHSRVELLAPDRPGELARVVRVVGIDQKINITGVVVPPTHGEQALVVLHLETDEPEPVVAALRRLGYEAGSPALLTRPA